MSVRTRRARIALVIPFMASALAAQAPAKKAPAPPAKTSTAKAVTKPSLLDPASLRARAPEVYKAKLETTKGDFTVEVTRAWAPLGADRFYNLVRNGFFTNASFFRVLKGFMVQFGINANPAVSRVWRTAPIKDDPVKESNRRGYVTFATAGPNTRTTQVFINFADNSGLDKQGFAPFGKVVEGMDVVDKLYDGYGEGAPEGKGPRQDRIEMEGKAYLDKAFPQLDSIKRASILPAESQPTTK